MKIVVCIKQVPATSEVKLNQETNTIVREGMEAVINPFDTHALETALRLKEQLAGDNRVITLSMGIQSVSKMLQETLALGADQAVLLSDRAFAGADTLATATALAAGIHQLGEFDLVICGKQATDGDTAQVGPSLAEKLQVPHLTAVRQISELTDRSISCSRLTDDGHETVKLSLPALITVVREINLPRLPSISGIRRSQAASVTVWTAADVGADPAQVGSKGSPTRVLRTFTPIQQVAGELLLGHPKEQALQLVARLEAAGLLQQGSEVQHG